MNSHVALASSRWSSRSAERGYRKLFLSSVTQADQGVDFDFLAAVHQRGRVPRS